MNSICLVLMFFLSLAKSDYLVFTSASQKALLYGTLLDNSPKSYTKHDDEKDLYDAKLELKDIVIIDNELSYPRNLAISAKNKKIYVCDVNYTAVTIGYIYEYSYKLGSLYY